MNKEFIPYEQALQLKELGFDEGYYFARYADSANLIPREEEDGWAWHLTKSAKAPLYQQAFRWFREKHDIHYSIDRHCSQHDYKWGYNWSLYNYTGIFDEFLTSHPDAPAGEWVCNTYEEAELECLKKLIEIVKNK